MISKDVVTMPLSLGGGGRLGAVFSSLALQGRHHKFEVNVL